jgi:hypothetical protein
MRQRGVKAVWIDAALKRPTCVRRDREDPALRLAYRQIRAAGNRVLCVVYNRTVVPPHVVTVFFED